jgi:hypothetical protein
MNITALSVMNSLYKLGITEQEFKNIQEEISHIERTGGSIKAVKGDKIIWINHDDKHNIVIEKYNKGDLKPNTRVLLKTYITFEDLPQEIYDLHTICRYRAKDFELKGKADNLDELKERILDRFADGYPKVLADEIYDSEWYGYDEEKRKKAKEKKAELTIKQLKAIYWLFCQEFNYYSYDFSKLRENIAQIVKVFEFKNRRLAIIQENEKFDKIHNGFLKAYTTENCKGIKLRIQVYRASDSDNNRFNYVDVGREIFFHYDKELWICDELLNKVEKTELDIISERMCYRKYLLLSCETYEREKNAVRIKMMKAKIEAKEEQAKERLTEKIENQFKNGKVVRNGVIITPNSISYEDIELKGDFLGNYIRLDTPHLNTTLDFNNLYANYVEFMLNQIQKMIEQEQGVEVNFNFGKIRIKISIKNKCFFVNDKRVRADEITKIILKALNYREQKKYDDFLADVSKESLRLKNALQQGILFTMKTDKCEDNCLIHNSPAFTFTLKLFKKKGKIYVRIGKKEYRVKSTPALFELEKKIDSWHQKTSILERTINLLYKALEGVTPQDIGKLIAIAKQEDIKRIERSKKFIENALRITSARKVERGYVVKGKSGNKYFIGNDLNVYKYRNGEIKEHICIVDYAEVRDETQQNDFIAKRILALHNDLDVAKEIHTLQLEKPIEQREYPRVWASEVE